VATLLEPGKLLKLHTGMARPEAFADTAKRLQDAVAKLEKQAAEIGAIDVQLSKEVVNLQSDLRKRIEEMNRIIANSTGAGAQIRAMAALLKDNWKDYERSARSVAEEFSALQNIYAQWVKAQAKGDARATELAEKAYAKASVHAEKTFMEVATVGKRSVAQQAHAARVVDADFSNQFAKLKAASAKVIAEMEKNLDLVNGYAEEIAEVRKAMK
jgi:DNA repair exonuclease SbcCD ATPase subunit